MDKKKIISSLTLAGMLATSVAGSGVFAAETSDPATKALGEYSKLITGKVAVPFILQSEADRVTGKDVKASFKNAATFTFNSTALADDQVLATGDVVYINGEARTIVIYGDTNCDGKINIMDAVTTLNHVKGKAELTGAAFAAADLNNNGDINILEAVGALNVVKGKAEYENIATAPKAEVSVLKDVEISSSGIKLSFDMNPEGYSYKLSEEDGTRISGTIITGATKNTDTGLYEYTFAASTLDPDSKYSVAILDKDGTEVATKTFTYRALNNVESIDTSKGISSENVKSFSVTAELTTAKANKVDTTIKATLTDGKNTVETTASLPANTVAAELNFGDVSILEDATLTINVVVMDADGNVTVDKTFSIVKAVAAPTVFVEATRSATDSATVTVTTDSSNAIYIVAKKADEVAPTIAELKESTQKVGTVSITADAHKIYVLVVNPQGTPSEIAVADVASSTAETLNPVGTPAIDDNGVATWTDTNTKEVTGYQVRILKDGVVIAETTVKEAKYDISSIAKENGEATYTVQVRANGNNTTTANSAYDESTTNYIIAALELTVEPTFTDGIVAWNQSDAEKADSVIVKLYKAIENEDPKLVKEINCANNTYSYDMNSAIESEGNGKYTASVTLKAKANDTAVDSVEKPILTPVYKAPAVTNVKATATDTSITVRFAPIDDIAGLTESYKLAYSSLDEKTGEWSKETESTAIATTPSDEKDKQEITLTPATASTKYKISILTMVKGGAELARTQTIEVSTTGTLIKSLENYTIKDISAKDAKFDAKGKNSLGINYDGELMIQDGKSSVKNQNEAPNAEEIKAVINMLKDGDKVTINAKGKVSAITLNASASVDRIVNLGTSLKDIALTINPDYQFNTIVNGEVKSVTVNARTDSNTGKADLVGLAVTDGVTVADGQNVAVKAGTKVTVPASAIVTVNGVKLATDATKEITLTANSKDELTIDGSGTGVTLTVDANKTVNFKGTQDGNVIVEGATKEATLTLKTLANSSSIKDLVINSEETTVNIVDVYMTGVIKDPESGKANGIIVSDVKIDDENVTITPISGNATVKYKNGKITDISGNVTVEKTGLTVKANEAVTTETALTKSNAYVIVNEGVNATYTLTAGTKTGVMTINLTAGTITLK